MSACILCVLVLAENSVLADDWLPSGSTIWTPQTLKSEIQEPETVFLRSSGSSLFRTNQYGSGLFGLGPYGRSAAAFGSGEPTADVFGSGDISAAHHAVRVPEPLLFDLVRPLGARRGEIEFNTLALFPWRSRNTAPEDDPFGSGPTTRDRQGIEWAPEIEYAIADNFAIEFEFPFEDSTLEEYKLGLQWTIGTAFDDRYIHGFQMLVEPNTTWRQWNATLLYLGGVRFDETWSALFMLGGRMDLEGPGNSDTFERLINASLFADLTDNVTVGLETNYAAGSDGTSDFIVVPQMHLEVTDHWQIQAGLGFGVASEGYEQSAIIRVIYSR